MLAASTSDIISIEWVATITSGWRPLRKRVNLRVCVHGNAGFVEDDGVKGPAAGKKPHSSEPHLESVAHPTEFGNKVVVSYHQLQVGALVASASPELLNLKPGPNLLRDLQGKERHLG
jgi:hypothetical protein